MPAYTEAINAVRESEELFRAIVETTPECVKLVAPDGTLLQINAPGLRMIGADSAELVVGKSFYALVAPEHRDRFCAFNERICRGERGSLEFDMIGLKGARLNMETCAAPFQTSDGTVVQLAVTRDISAHKQAELDRDRALAAAQNERARLQRANANWEQFAYSASHDLQEPIRNISIYGELLSRHYGQALDATGKEYVALMTSGARHLRMLVKDLLAYAQSAKVEDEVLGESDADAALGKALANLSASIGASHAEITHAELPSLRVREIHLEQLFQNLIGNAIKYRREDEPPRIRVTAERNGGDWLFAVRDNGIGIAPEHKNLVFGLFKRLHNKTKYSGAGIGLAICQRIVECNGGRIWVESEGPGEGSTFHFTLPA